jgi:hypothetical protein
MQDNILLLFYTSSEIYDTRNMNIRARKADNLTAIC